MADEGKKDENANPFEKATAEQRAAYRKLLDAADAAAGGPSNEWRVDGEDFSKLRGVGHMSDSEFDLEKRRLLAHTKRESRRKQHEANIQRQAERSIKGESANA